MRKFFLGLLITGAAVSCFGSSPAKAANFSGNYLMHVCASDAQGKELVPGGHIACQAYIAGVIDYHTLIRSMGAAPGVDFCIPESEDLYSIQHKVMRYIYKNRSLHAQFIASPAVALALYNSYPCEADKKKTKKRKR